MEGFLVASDIHGNSEAFARLKALQDEHQLDSMLVCGDLQPASLDQGLLALTPMTLVRGNCDNPYDFQLVARPLPPLLQRISWHGRTLVMTHGDRWNSPYGLSMQKHDIFLFGHIHLPRLYENEEGILILNPGSASYPRGGNPASYAILSPTRIEIRSLWEDRVLQALDIEDLSAR